MNFRKIAQVSMLGLAVFSMGTPAADARVRDPRVTSIAAGCGAIQDELDQIIKAFRNAKTRAEADALRARGHSLVLDWNALGCTAAFGNWWRKASQRSWQWSAPNAGVVVATPPAKPSRRATGRLPNTAIAD